MSPQTKLALRRWMLRKLRYLVDAIDDRLHTAEVRLREQISTVPVYAGKSAPSVVSKPAHRGETFEQWEARRSGVRVAPRPRRRRGISSAEFNSRMAAQLEEAFSEGAR